MDENPIVLIAGTNYVYWYGFVISIGIILGAALTCILRLCQGHKSIDDILLSAVVALPITLVSARVYFCWHGTDMFSQKSDYFELSNGGFSVYGALIGFCVAVAVSALFQRKNILEMLDAFSPGIALAICIGRLAAVFSGENLGAIVESSAFQRFPFAVFKESEGAWRMALFSGQSLVALIICCVLIWLLLKKYNEQSIYIEKGDIFLLFIVLFMVTQGVFETYRHDPLFFNAIFIQKLQTIQAAMPVGAIFSAAALSVFILRLMWRTRFRLSSLLYVAACGVFYLCYFNIVLRIEFPSETISFLVMLIGCIGLIGVAIRLLTALQKTRSDCAANNPSHAQRPSAKAASRNNPRSRVDDYWS